MLRASPSYPRPRCTSRWPRAARWRAQAWFSTCAPRSALPRVRRPDAAAQIDTQWKGHANFTFYDFGKPEEVPEALHHQARAARGIRAASLAEPARFAV